MVYQEQIMRILNRLGGIELSKSVRLHQGHQQEGRTEKINADAGRLPHRLLEKQRGSRTPSPRTSSTRSSSSPAMASTRAHTAAYAQIGYQTAYLKTHFTAEFMAALLSSE